MWFIILLIILVVSIFLEALISLPLLLILVIAQSSFDDLLTSAAFAFCAGILMDITKVRILGLTSLFLLAISLIVQLYKKRFREESIFFLFIITFLAVHIYHWLFVKEGLFFPLEALLSSLLVILLTGLLYSFKPKS